MKIWLRRVLAVMAVVVITASTASAYSPAQVLSRGARGNDVATLQRLLTYWGEPVAITALIGPTTEGLIKRVQRRFNLVPDGIVGSVTWRHLTPTLRRGDGGEAVRALQFALNEKYQTRLATDGTFGPATETAVRRFQYHMGLSADGIVGAVTWDALLGHFIQLESSSDGWYQYPTTNTGANWGTGNTIATLKEVFRQWSEAGHQIRIGVGDISQTHGGYLPGHASHQRGVDADLRLVRRDGLEASVAYYDPAYSRALTQKLVDLLWSTGEVEVIFLNDPLVRGVQPWPNHDAHMHVRFRR